jgi:phosphoribosylglycinamide formyltransferase-1
MHTPRLGILGSTRGTNLLTLINAIQTNRLQASIPIVISNKSDALILERARSHHLNAQFVDPTGLSRTDYDKKLSTLLQAAQVDLVVLIGYMRILSPEFVSTWQDKIINVHPSLLPQFAGGMDAHVHQAVLDAGVKETGCTVHRVTAEVDAGPILIQEKCAVLPDDTVETLKERVQQLEGEALIKVIATHLCHY